ncbi:helix-turn-helix domain-containing protein [Microbacterium luticocti]|uniref:helix-turn-helix domain-containing protein n=1 Tax=Microbacterium luticocti TaxID=451764 RepID=UPI0009FD3F50
MNRDELSARVTCTVEEAAKALGISRGAAYEAARRGDLPVTRFGTRMLVSTRRLIEMIDAPTPVR